MLEMLIEQKRGGEFCTKFTKVVIPTQRYEFWAIVSKYHFGELKFIHDSRSMVFFF